MGIATAFIVLVLAWICYSLVSTVWSVYFGSLSSIPGPKLAAATRLVIISHKARGNAETWRVQLHRRYGDTVRVGPCEVSFAGAAGWKEIYGFAPGSQYAMMERDQKFYAPVTTERSILSAYPVEHHRQRKSFAPAFADKALREQEPLVKRYVAQLISNVEKSTKSPDKKAINLVPQYNFATFDIMADLAFGAPLGCLETSEYVSWVTNVLGFLKLVTILNEVNHHEWLKKLLHMMIPASFKEKTQEHFQFSVDRVEKRLSEKTTKKDIWHFVLAAEEKNIKLTRGEMHANAAVFLTAGSETIATLLAGLTYYLVANPDKLKILAHEIRGRFASSDQINAQEASSLRYFTACVYEAFRMHPPVPIGMPRLVPAGGAEVCGHRIPGGTSVYSHQLSMYRSQNNFSDPDTFLPERWLSDEYDVTGSVPNTKNARAGDSQFSNDKRACLQPFSIGPENCIGQNLAWVEIRLIIANMIWHFDLELCEESQGWDEQKVFSLWSPGPLMVVARPVER